MEQAHTDRSRLLEDFAEIASDWFWETDAEHRFTFLSQRAGIVLQVDLSEIIGRRRDAITPEHANDPKWQAHLEDLHQHRPFRNFEYSFLRKTDGKLLWLRVSGQPIFDESGVFLGFRGVGADFTHEREAMENLRDSNAALAERNRELNLMRRALERSATEDSLTNLLNRHAFERDVAEALDVAGNAIILLHIDLDRFKWINDTLGHSAGDTVLTTTAERLRHIASGFGPVYRVGGDEFQIVLADNADIERARWISDAVLEAMAAPIMIDKQSVTISASIGIAQSVGGQVTPRRFIANADIALLHAKDGGGARAQEVTARMLAEIASRRQLAAELPTAIEEGQVVAYFQPQVHAATDTVVGAEALARWDHPKLGLLPPAAFLDIASDMGLLAALDRTMMVQALNFADTLSRQGLSLAAVSVNLSAGRLMDPQLPNDIANCWTERSCQLCVELLETISLDDVGNETVMHENITRLRDMGVQIETDDFGSGRASITSLLNVRPDRVKVDRNLIQSAINDPAKREVVAAILEMTRALGMETLAEGVETEEDIKVIRALGFEYFQGYAYSPPLSQGDFAEFLMNRPRQAKTQTAGLIGLPKHA